MANVICNEKPDKPYPEFLLYADRNGQWAKKISGQTWFFGKYDDPAAAIELLFSKARKPAILPGVFSMLLHRTNDRAAGTGPAIFSCFTAS